MEELDNNWDRQLESVFTKRHNVVKHSKELGERAELDNEELRSVFPVIQRLNWTKWDGMEIWMHSFEMRMPLTFIFLNLARPSKAQRCLLYLSRIMAIFLICTVMMYIRGPVSEGVDAGRTPLADLF